jgi:hypothetical protein
MALSAVIAITAKPAHLQGRGQLLEMFMVGLRGD